MAVALNRVDHKIDKPLPGPLGTRLLVAIGESVTAPWPDVKIGDAVCNSVHGSDPVDKEIEAFTQLVLAQTETLSNTPRGAPWKALLS